MESHFLLHRNVSTSQLSVNGAFIHSEKSLPIEFPRSGRCWGTTSHAARDYGRWHCRLVERGVLVAVETSHATRLYERCRGSNYSQGDVVLGAVGDPGVHPSTPNGITFLATRQYGESDMQELLTPDTHAQRLWLEESLI